MLADPKIFLTAKFAKQAQRAQRIISEFSYLRP